MKTNLVIIRPDEIPEEASSSPAVGDRSLGIWLARAAFGGTGLLILFWTLYFARVISHAADPATAQFESAFPLADGFLAAMLLVAGAGLLRGRPIGLFSLVGGAAMTLYLGLLDLTFYANQGFFASPNPDAVFQGVITLCCLAGGFLGLLFGWKLWRNQ
jgi:hypothetical protein